MGFMYIPAKNWIWVWALIAENTISISLNNQICARLTMTLTSFLTYDFSYLKNYFYLSFETSHTYSMYLGDLI